MTAERWQLVKEVFQSAVECSAEDRDAFVASKTDGDLELRREVDKMLRHSSGTGFLDRPAWDGTPLDVGPAVGSRLGPYELVEEAGAGGMGRVYKARDTRLGRIVAIKILSAEFSYRFQTEARAISALNHPHVCALYDIGEQDGTAYLVMEYVEGESLSARLSDGPLPLNDVFRFGAEIADALAAAHALGMIHRDLKPANIMITKSGAKVLDFGLAQMAASDGAAEHLPPEGGVMGTLAYMSPSQLNGNPSDPRSDIFALGLVLYEMASGRRAFSGDRDTHVDLPPLTGAPPRLADLVSRCLREDAASRVQSMEEVRFTLERLRSEPPARLRTGRRKLAWMAAAVVLAAGVGLTWKFMTPAPKPVPMSSTVKAAVIPEKKEPAPAPQVQPKPPENSAPAPHPIPAPPLPPVRVALTSYPGLERDPTFSPDGRNIAFSWHATLGGGYGIYTRPVTGTGELQKLTDGLGEDYGPAWSPDGRKIAFRHGGRQSGIYTVPAAGEFLIDARGNAQINPTLLASIAKQGQETLPQMSWSHDGKWIAAPDRDPSGGTQIYLFPAGRGEKRKITFNASGTDHAPAFSPDGRSLAYASCPMGVFPCDVYVIPLGPGITPLAQRKITPSAVYIRGIAWLADGKSLVYSGGNSISNTTYLWRVSVNPPGPPERLDIAGSRVRHPATSVLGGRLAYTDFAPGNWDLMLIENLR